MPGPKTPVNIRQYRGRVTLLALIATGCQHCLTTTPLLVRVQKDLGPRGLRVIAGVADDTPWLSVPAFVEKYKINFPVGYVDKPLFQKITNSKDGDVLYVPTLLFIDARGMVRLQLAGNDSTLKGAAQDKTIRAVVEELLRESAAGAVKK